MSGPDSALGSPAPAPKPARDVPEPDLFGYEPLPLGEPSIPPWPKVNPPNPSRPFDERRTRKHPTPPPEPTEAEMVELLRQASKQPLIAVHKNELRDVLAERGRRYGDFADNADIAQCFKTVLRNSPRWGRLQPDQKEALEVIASKISRILTGDPDYDDNWVDIAGYATLVADRLKRDATSATNAPG